MNFFLFLSATIRIIYLFSSNPISFIVIIIIQTVLICLIAWLKINLTWFSFILFLIFLGGLLVLFIYIARLARNEKIRPSVDRATKIFFIGVVFLAVTIYIKNSQLIINEYLIIEKSLNLIYSSSIIILITITILYLLFTLVVVVKVANKFNAPIKNLI